MRLFPKKASENIVAAFAATLFGLLFAKDPFTAKLGTALGVYAAANVILALVRFLRWLAEPPKPLSVNITIVVKNEDGEDASERVN